MSGNKSAGQLQLYWLLEQPVLTAVKFPVELHCVHETFQLQSATMQVMHPIGHGRQLPLQEPRQSLVGHEVIEL